MLNQNEDEPHAPHPWEVFAVAECAVTFGPLAVPGVVPSVIIYFIYHMIWCTKPDFVSSEEEVSVGHEVVSHFGHRLFASASTTSAENVDPAQ